MNKRELLKIYFDNELYIQNPPLSTMKFIEYCNQRGLNVNENELENLEKESKFFPFFRVKNICIEEASWYSSVQFEKFGSKNLKELFDNDNIYVPEEMEFKPYSSFEEEDKMGYNTSSYYSNFQFELLKDIKTRNFFEEEILNKHIDSFDFYFQFFILIQDYMPYARSDTENILIYDDFNDWNKKINNFNLNEVLKVLNLNILNVLDIYLKVSYKTKTLGSKEWIQLYKNIDYNMEAKLRGEIRANLDYLDYAMMVKRCIEDYLKHEIWDFPECCNYSSEYLLNIKPKWSTNLKQVKSKRLYFLLNNFSLNYHPKMIIFVEGKTEYIFLKKYFELFGNSIENLRIDIINFEGIDKFFGESLTLQNAEKKYIKKHISNYNHMITYLLDKWQCIPYFLGDSENNISEIITSGQIITSFRNNVKDISFPQDWYWLWNEDFELDNYSLSKIVDAINKVLNLDLTEEKAEEIWKLKDKNKKSINDLDENVNKNKIEINNILFENIKKDYIKNNLDLSNFPMYQLIYNIVNNIDNKIPVINEENEKVEIKRIENILKNKEN